jgi:hypothetical protein
METVAYFTPTICRLLNIPKPNLSSAESSNEIINYSGSVLGQESIQKCLIYAPDAIGEVVFNKYPKLLKEIIRIAPLQIRTLSELPSYTPVSYASMFTGAKPNEHGIAKYEKIVLICDTLFDALIRAEKRVALVAVDGCSNSIIFQNREIDYFIEPHDEMIENRAIKLVKSRNYDLILVDRQDYDRALHQTNPYSQKSINALKRLIKGFIRINRIFQKINARSSHLITFVSDHGAHINPETGKGDHGSDSFEDVMLLHFWGVYPALKQ